MRFCKLLKIIAFIFWEYNISTSFLPSSSSLQTLPNDFLFHCTRFAFSSEGGSILFVLLLLYGSLPLLGCPASAAGSTHISKLLCHFTSRWAGPRSVQKEARGGLRRALGFLSISFGFLLGMDLGFHFSFIMSLTHFLCFQISLSLYRQGLCLSESVTENWEVYWGLRVLLQPGLHKERWHFPLEFLGFPLPIFSCGFL